METLRIFYLILGNLVSGHQPKILDIKRNFFNIKTRVSSFNQRILIREIIFKKKKFILSKFISFTYFFLFLDSIFRSIRSDKYFINKK